MAAEKGRPTKYDDDMHPLWAWSLATEGKTDKEIAERMGITVRTLNNWKKSHTNFLHSLKEGKEPADAKVEQSLYKRATGYRYKEKKVIQIIDKDGNAKPARIELVEKELAPDTTACIYWLKNRKRDSWKDKQDVELTNDSDITFNFVPASQKKKEDEENE